MRIYTAGFHSALGSARLINDAIAKTAKPDWILESYFYLKKKELEEIREANESIFLDSGAYSMFTKGVSIDLADYAKFIHENRANIHIASSLDVIGSGKEQESYDNFKKIAGYGAKVQPVHHAGDHDDWLKRYLDEGYDHIFLGGMVSKNRNYLRDWLDGVWEKYLTNPDGTPRVRVHGFGLTALDIIFRYPWFSVDSTSWLQSSRHGAIFLDLRDRVHKIDFSDRSSKRFDQDSWHYSGLKPSEQEVINQRLAELEAVRPRDPEVELWAEEQTGIKQGYNPEALSKMYGWRDFWNIDFFGRQQHRGVDRFIRKQMALFD